LQRNIAPDRSGSAPGVKRIALYARRMSMRVIIVIAVNFLGDGLQEAFDPRSQP
jgi:hypothetical protein